MSLFQKIWSQMNIKTCAAILSTVLRNISFPPAISSVLQKCTTNLWSSCLHWPLLCTSAFVSHFHQNPISPPQPESPLWNSTPLSTILAFLWWMAAPQVLSACPSSPAIKTLGMANIFLSLSHPSPFKTLVPHATPPLSGHHHCSPLPPHLSHPPSLQHSSPSSTAPRTPQSILWRKNIIYSVLPR